MKKKPAISLIELDPSLATPVYKQIVQSIYRNIENGVLAKDDLLPSVNQIAAQFSLARGSVFAAYNDLRASGIIDSIPGKGYYVSSTETRQKQNIFLLFSTFTPYKETLFNALLNHLPKTSSLDIYFHYHSIKMFETLIKEQAAYYNTYIIMPEVNADTPSILSRLDPKNTYLLDVGYKEYKKLYPGVYQNFEKDIYSILMDSQHLVAKYKRLFLIFPDSLRTRDIISGFNKFSKKNIIHTEVKNRIAADQIQKDDAFIVIDDNDLVKIIQAAKQKKWKLGQDIGIISYNETNLKSVIADGITTITTDFAAMGKTIAEMAVSGKGEIVENAFIMIDRKSF
ncbi:MAG TPA: GntR family transcriptional regulator [Puia sp.]|jgi:DNA-binding transcriptional regulator YhcF (GntR family)|nr:GntR family transcriptional regulator [Puia sp.]